MRWRALIQLARDALARPRKARAAAPHTAVERARVTEPLSAGQQAWIEQREQLEEAQHGCGCTWAIEFGSGCAGTRDWAYERR